MLGPLLSVILLHPAIVARFDIHTESPIDETPSASVRGQPLTKFETCLQASVGVLVAPTALATVQRDVGETTRLRWSVTLSVRFNWFGLPGSTRHTRSRGIEASASVQAKLRYPQSGLWIASLLGRSSATEDVLDTGRTFGVVRKLAR